MNICEIVVGR